MKRIVFISVFAMLLVCLLAICVGATGPKDLFSTVTILENIDKTESYGYGETDFSRIVMADPQNPGQYITYPAYYIFGKRDHKTEGDQPLLNLSPLNTATGRTGTQGEFKAEHIICLEIPNVFTAFSSNYTKTNTMTSLQYLKISKNIRLVHGGVFRANKSLIVIEFEDNFEEGASLKFFTYCFDDCDSLTRIDFPVHLKALGERSFGDCDNLEIINFAKGTDFTLYNEDGTIKANTVFAAFINDTALKSIRLPDGITSTGNLACGGCSSLEYVYIPASCKSIDAQAFNNCNALKTIEFAPNSQLETIGQKAIAESSAITEIIFPNTFLTTSGEAPIRNLPNLTYINFGASFTGFTGYASMHATNNSQLVVVLPSCFDTQYVSQLPTNATILYTGTKAQAEGFGYATIQSYEEWENEGSPKGKRIVYGYNVCQAFYGGSHALTGTETVSVKDFYSNISVGDFCTRPDCGLGITNKTIAPIFECLGTSVSEYKDLNGNYSISVFYKVNDAAYNEYLQYGTLSFGLVASSSAASGNQPLTVTEGKVTPVIKEKTHVVAQNKFAHDYVVLRVSGITPAHSGTSLVLSMYVYDGNNIYYLNEKSQDLTAEYMVVSIADEQ